VPVSACTGENVDELLRVIKPPAEEVYAFGDGLRWYERALELLAAPQGPRELGTDPATGLPVFSLYGKTRVPTAEMLGGVDALTELWPGKPPANRCPSSPSGATNM